MAEVSLKTLKRGNVFKADGVEYMVIEEASLPFIPGINTVRVIRKETLGDAMAFDSGAFNSNNNNWLTSSLREYLNTDYLGEIEKTFGKGNIVKHRTDLCSLDGTKEYGMAIDKVGLLNLDEYRKCRDIMGGTGKHWWLITPFTSDSKGGNHAVLIATSDGCVNYEQYSSETPYVRPVFGLNGDIMVESVE